MNVFWTYPGSSFVCLLLFVACKWTLKISDIDIRYETQYIFKVNTAFIWVLDTITSTMLLAFGKICGVFTTTTQSITHHIKRKKSVRLSRQILILPSWVLLDLILPTFLWRWEHIKNCGHYFYRNPHQIHIMYHIILFLCILHSYFVRWHIHWISVNVFLQP